MDNLDEQLRESFRRSAEGLELSEPLLLPSVHERARAVRMRALVWALVLALLVATGTIAGLRIHSSSSTPSFVEQGKKGVDPHLVRTRQEIAYNFKLVDLPAGAVQAQTSPVPALASGPPERIAASHFIFDTRWWTVPASVAATYNWVHSHPPAGMHIQSEEISLTASSSPVKSLGYEGPFTDAFEYPQLMFSIAPAGRGKAAVRVDSTAVWLSSGPAPDSIPGPKVRVTIANGCPQYFGQNDVTNPPNKDLTQRLLPAAAPTSAIRCHYRDERVGQTARYAITLSATDHLDRDAARGLADTINRLPLSSPGEVTHMCPTEAFGGNSDLFEIIVFAYDNRPDVDIYHSSFCWGRADNGFIMTTQMIPVF